MRRVNRAELAEIFGVTVVTVDAWVRRGCPFIQRGSKGTPWIFDTAEVVKWRTDQAREEAAGTAQADVDELERRKLAAITAKHELELAKARGDVAPLDQVERMVARAFAEVRGQVRNIPGRVVTRLLGETDERRFKQVLMDEIDQALEALADTSLVEEDEDSEGIE